MSELANLGFGIAVEVERANGPKGTVFTKADPALLKEVCACMCACVCFCASVYMYVCVRRRQATKAWKLR